MEYAFVREITHRRAAEQALPATEERYRLLHESLMDAFVMVDMSGHLLECNTVYQQMLGYTEEELRQLRYWDLTPERWHAVEAQIVAAQIIPNGRSEVYEKEYIRKDGTVFPVELRTFLLRDKAGQPATMWAIVRDITGRKQAESARQEALDRLQKIASRVPGMVYQFRLRPDGSSCFPFASDAIRGIFRVGPDEVRNDAAKAFAVVHPDDHDGLIASIQVSAGSLEPWRHEFRVLFDEGTVRWLFGDSTPEREEDGGTLWHGFITDVTERKQVEKALRVSAQYARSLLEASLDPLVTINVDGKVTDVNSATEQATGVPRDQLIGSDFSDYFTQREKARSGHLEAFSQGFVTDYPLAIRHRSGKITDVLFNANVYRDEHGAIAGIFAAARDITSLRRSQAELEKTNREIRTLGEMTDLLQSCQSTDEFYAIIRATMIQLFPEVSGACFIFDESESLLKEVAQWGRFAPREKIFSPNDCWALRRGHIHVIDATEAMAPRCRHLRHESTAYLCVPLLAQGKTLGLIYLSSDAGSESKARNQRGLQLVEAASNSISLALANLQLRESLALLSLSDPLTGLYNRRFMEETLARELSRVSRNNGTLVIAMLDIDRFKDFNDAYGHDAGDFVLKEFAAQMKRFRHGTDVSCRYGGEEFVLILPEIAPEMAVERLDRLRQSIGELSLNHQGRPLPPITVSIGVACFPVHGTSAPVLIRAADVAMYQAKREGRNRLVKADPPG